MPNKEENQFISVTYIIGASILVGAILISASIFYNTKLLMGGGSLPVTPAQNQTQGSVLSGGKISTKGNAPALGNVNAKVTVVEYADYQCPFCERWYTAVMPTLITKYINTGKIKFIYQDFTFLGPDSNTAAEATHCAADQGKFWQYHDYLFEHQGQEGSSWATVAHQKEFATAVGLNTTQFNSCLDSGKYKQEVLDETAAGKAGGVNATPTVFVGGTPIVGAQPLDVFVQAIDTALK